MTPPAFAYISGIITVPRFCKIASAFAVIGPLAASIIKGAFIFLALPGCMTPSVAAGIRMSHSNSKTLSAFSTKVASL